MKSKKPKSNFNNPTPRPKAWGAGSGSPYDFMNFEKQLIREARGWDSRPTYRNSYDEPNMYGMLDAA